MTRARFIHRTAKRSLRANPGHRCVCVVAGQHLVIYRSNLAPPHADISARLHALWVGGRRKVEGACERGTPIEQQRAVVILAVVNAESTNVAPVQILTPRHWIFGLIVCNVNAPKDKPGFSNAKRVQFGIEAVVLSFSPHKSVRIRVVRVNITLNLFEPRTGTSHLGVEVCEQRIRVRLLVGDGVR